MGPSEQVIKIQPRTELVPVTQQQNRLTRVVMHPNASARHPKKDFFCWPVSPSRCTTAHGSLILLSPMVGAPGPGLYIVYKIQSMLEFSESRQIYYIGDSRYER